MTARRTTGLAGLDARLKGGILPGTVHLIWGPPMNALELLGLHFAAGGAGLGGARYISTDRSADEVLHGVERIGGAAKKVEVLPLPHKGKWVIPDLKEGFRYVVDDIASVTVQIGFDDLWARLIELRQQARTTGAELVLVLTAGLLEPQQEIRIQAWADGVLELGFDRQGFGLFPYLKITKMRGAPESAEFLLFKEREKGLFMESTRRVF